VTGAGPRSVLLAGGGTAGHVSPLLALADCLRRRDPGVLVTALGTAAGLEARLVPERGYPLLEVPKVPFPRRPSGDLLRLPANLRRAVRAAEEAIESTGAEVVVGFGGYVSTPAYLAARRRHVPIVVHEQNARPGLANRLGARLAARVAVTFAGTALPHATVTGMPLRREIATLDRAAHRDEARARFGLGDGPTVLVTGGSLGAQRLNDAFAAAAAGLSAAGVQVLHVTGTGKEFVPEGVGAAPYVVLPYCDRMDLAYAAADLAVARSGANTVCELTAVGLPAVYVPLPIGNGEQRLNAAAVISAGGGLLVDDAAVTAAWVEEVVRPMALDRSRLAAMATASASVGERGGDELLADLVVAAAAGTASAAGGR
jgi:UDP-N-acetylglucosamine--N-acetylmuramyl-(pentapeptide) pyrophosphoryl-undecaprenol N-acetylglucosamine transferase